VNVSGDHFHGHEVPARARVEEDEPVFLGRAELEVEVEVVVSAHLRQSQISGLGMEGDRVVHGLVAPTESPREVVRRILPTSNLRIKI